MQEIQFPTSVLNALNLLGLPPDKFSAETVREVWKFRTGEVERNSNDAWAYTCARNWLLEWLNGEHHEELTGVGS